MSLYDVKPGDCLATTQYQRTSLYKVDRVTQTQVICGASRFNKESGKLIGSNAYFSVFARIATPADVRNVAISRAQQRLREFKVTDENLSAVEALLERS